MSVLDGLYAKARLNPQRVAFPEASNEKMMQAAYETGRDGFIRPILVGDAAALRVLALERGYDPQVFSFVDIHDEEYKDLGKYAYGEVELDEGARFNAVVRGISRKNRPELVEKLPIPCHAAICQRDGYKTVVFDLAEEE